MDKPFVPFPDIITPYCKNCGHKSHCGIRLMREEYNGRGKHLGQIEVCKKCRCVECARDEFAIMKENKDGSL